MAVELDFEAIENDENMLQKHVAFFDRNNDGVIYPWETYQGFRAIGSGILLSSIAAVFINVGLSRKTRPGKRFVPSKFEEIFHKYSRTNPETLTANELDEFIKGNREPKDYGGWIGGLSKWKILYYLAKDKNGLLKKDTIRAVYDGSLFKTMAAEAAKKKNM